MLNEYKSNLSYIVDKGIEIYSSHNLILKKLGCKLMLARQIDQRSTWEIRIKQRLHIEMKKELRQMLTTKSIWNNQKVHQQFNRIDNREEPYLDELDKVPPVNQLAQNVISKLEKVNQQMHLPKYLKEVLETHQYQLKRIYTVPSNMRLI